MALCGFVIALLVTPRYEGPQQAFPLAQLLNSVHFILARETSRLLEAVAPLIVRQLAILEGVTRVEKRLDTGLVLIQVDGIDLRMVKQEVIVHVQLVEHPAQGVLADGQDASVKPALGCVGAGGLDDSVRVLVKSSKPVLQPGGKVPQLLVCAGTPFCLMLWWLRLWETRTGPVTEGGEAFASRTSMELQLALGCVGVAIRAADHG